MTPAEQTAFVDAYCANLAYMQRDTVAKFVRQWAAGEDIDHKGLYTSVIDALLMWHSACKWQATQSTPR